MAHRLHRYTDTANMEEVSERLPNKLRYIEMAFRPANVLLFCLCMTIIIAIPCIIAVYMVPRDSTGYAIVMAILTGVVASCIVSVSIELANNYRHNQQRFVVLNEYLYGISMYEQLIKWASHGAYESYSKDFKKNWFEEELNFSAREKAVAEIILEFGPIVEQSLLNGREYFSIKELQLATRAVDAADKLGENVADIINNHLVSRQHSFYDLLDEPFSTKIKAFSECEGIYIVDQNLESIVCDYILCNLDELGHLSNDEETNALDRSTRNQIIHCLRDFDEAMHELQGYAKREPIVYDNLVPIEEKMMRWERKHDIPSDLHRK